MPQKQLSEYQRAVIDCVAICDRHGAYYAGRDIRALSASDVPPVAPDEVLVKMQVRDARMIVGFPMLPGLSWNLESYKRVVAACHEALAAPPSSIPPETKK